MTQPTPAPAAPAVEGQPPQPPAPEPAAGAPQVTPSSSTEKGFPEGTPVADMTPDQQLAYWKHYARKHEDAVKAFQGKTPQQLADMQTELEQLRERNMTADEKLLNAARKEAAKQAKEAAEAEYLPQIRAARVQSIASQVVQGDKLSAFMELVDTSKLLGEDGNVDETKVMGYLTAMYGETTPSSAGPRPPQWQNFGQFTSPPPRGKPGEAGAAEAQKRFGTKANT